MGIMGLNLTLPHKIEVIDYLDELDEAAELIGAVNTVKFTENNAVGYNTDGVGAVKAIEETTPVKGKKNNHNWGRWCSKGNSIPVTPEWCGRSFNCQPNQGKSLQLKE